MKLIRITTTPMSLRILLRGQLAHFNQYYEVIGVSSPGEELEAVSRSEKIRVKGIKMTRRISLFADLVSLIRLIVFIINEKPQIVHTHTPKAGTLGMLAAWICRVPVRLHTVAGLPLLEESGMKRRVLNFVEKITYACSTQVMPNSFGLKEIILTNRFTRPEKVIVIGNGSSNGIDMSYFSRDVFSSSSLDDLRNSLKINHDDFVFVFVGRMVKDKGVNELVHAFNEISKENGKTKLILVGPQESDLDPLDNDTLSLIQNNAAIITTGLQSDVRPFFAISHVAVLPSYREGFPNVPLQACAMDLPCIVTDINGCNEIISDGLNGLIVPVKSTIELLKAMRKTMNDSNLYKDLSLNSRSSIKDKYEQQILWAEIRKEYNKQLKRAGCV